MAQKTDLSSLPIIGQVAQGDFFEFFPLWDERLGSSLVLVATFPKIDSEPKAIQATCLVSFFFFYFGGRVGSFFLPFTLFPNPLFLE